MAKQTNTPKAAAKAAAPKAKAAPVVPTPAPVVAAPVVAVTRLQVQAVALALALANKPYKVAAGHNAAWWKQVTDAIGAGKGRAVVQELTKAGVPPAFVGYSVRRGWLVAA